MSRLTEALKILFTGEESYTSDPTMPQASLLIVPVDPAQRPEQPGQEIRDSVLSLRFHPGFQWLCSKKRFQRAVLEAKLKQEKHADLREVDLLQALIGALLWDEQQVDLELSRSKPTPVSPTQSEQKLFEQIQQSIELV